jgi:hypothetical protein
MHVDSFSDVGERKWNTTFGLYFNNGGKHGIQNLMVYSKFFETVHPELVLILGKKIEIRNITKGSPSFCLVPGGYIPYT